MYLGEIISLGVAVSWTVTAMASEVATKRMGTVVANVWRMLFAMLCSAVLCWFLLGSPLPVHASATTWGWLLLSGVVGYFFGDWCLFNSYIWMGSRYGQLFMTLAPMFAALAAWVSLGQVLSLGNVVAMFVTLSGIAISVIGRSQGAERHERSGIASRIPLVGSATRLRLSLPWQGVLYGIGAGMGQGFGLVLSKIGLDAYTRDVPAALLPDVVNDLPFSANMIRCVAGLICFSSWYFLHSRLRSRRHPSADTSSANTPPQKTLTAGLHDVKGMRMLLLAVLFGPFLGVGFSLMAVQYTAAGIASTLMATTPIIILLPSWYFFHQPITAKVVAGAIISVIGVSLFFLI